MGKKTRFDEPQFEPTARYYGAEVYENPKDTSEAWTHAFSLSRGGALIHVYHFPHDRVEIRLSGKNRNEKIFFKDLNFTANRIFTAIRRKIDDEVELFRYLAA